MQPLNQEDVLKLNNPHISKREYEAIVECVNDRVNHIWRTLLKTSGRKIEWWAFQNDVSLGDGDGSTGGEYDPATDSEFIELIGEWDANLERDGDFAVGFPTRFLWTEDIVWQAEVINRTKDNVKKIKQERKKAKSRREALKKERQAAIASIKKKLTKEELKHISFKE